MGFVMGRSSLAGGEGRFMAVEEDGRGDRVGKDLVPTGCRGVTAVTA
jgi:hypothetical protein